MTVKELIEALSKLDPELVVYTEDNDWCQLIEVHNVTKVLRGLGNEERWIVELD